MLAVLIAEMSGTDRFLTGVVIGAVFGLVGLSLGGR